MQCKICNNETILFDKAQVLKKYDIAYFRCSFCGFMQTEQPYWLAESYHSAIADDDTGLVKRNLIFAKIIPEIIKSFFEPKKFLDYGGGYGLFVRLMRDQDLDYYRYDRFCPNLFAKGFEGNIDKNIQYELITAFEVFEHFIYPLVDIEFILQSTRTLIFSTECIPLNNPPNLHEWYYYVLSSGQHISFYTLEALYIIAKKHGLNFYTDGRWLHIFTDKEIQHPHFKLVRHNR